MGAPGKNGPAGFASYGPRPQLLTDFTKAKGHGKVKAKSSKPSDSGLLAATRGFPADAFFGASRVVASALGATPGAAPARLAEHTTGACSSRPKPELSAWLATASFLLCLDTFPTSISRLWHNAPVGLKAGLTHSVR